MPALVLNRLGPVVIADLAVTALHDEVDLTPKPGLVDRRGPGAHDDMTRAMLHASAGALHTSFVECASAASRLPLGTTLRARIGVIGRAGERSMLDATGGVNTHRGALWALGLLSAALGAGAASAGAAVAYAARLAQIPDPALVDVAQSHGARARNLYRVSGAPGEAQAGFPNVMRYALPALRSHRDSDCDAARLEAFLGVVAHLDDTCVLHRGGAEGLAAVQSAARAVLDAGGMGTRAGRARFWELDRLCAARRLSPGGAGDLLAVALFLDTFDLRSAPVCKP